MAEMTNDVNFKFYAVNKENKLVYGFDDIKEAKYYCTKHRFKICNKIYLKKNNIDFRNLNNWTDNYPEYDI